LTAEEIGELQYLVRWAARRNVKLLAICVGKRSFNNPQDAGRAIRHPGLASYRCPYCGQWHVGAARPKAARGRDPARLRRELRTE